MVWIEKIEFRIKIKDKVKVRVTVRVMFGYKILNLLSKLLKVRFIVGLYGFGI